MELLFLGLNGSILSLLYTKLLENEKLLAELKLRIANLEGAIIERRKPIRSDCNLRDLDLE